MEQRNLLLAIVVSVVILIGFQYLFEKMRPPTPATPPSPAATQTVPAPPAPGTTSPGATAPAAPGAAKAMTAVQMPVYESLSDAEIERIGRLVRAHAQRASRR